MKVAIGHIKNDRGTAVVYERQPDLVSSLNLSIRGPRSFEGTGFGVPKHWTGQQPYRGEYPFFDLSDIFPGVTGTGMILSFISDGDLAASATTSWYAWESTGPVGFGDESGIVWSNGR